MTLEQLLEGIDATDNANLLKQIQQKLTDNGCKMFIDDGKTNIYVPKSRLDDALEKHRVAQQTIQAQAGTITKLQTQASDQSKAAAEVETLKKTIEENNKTIKGLAIKSALSSECEKMGFVIPADDILKFIDEDNITVGKDGNVLGVTEALKALKKSKPYLVKQSDGNNGSNDSNNNPNAQQQQNNSLNQMFQGGTGDPGKGSNVQFGAATYKAGSFGALLGKSVAKQSDVKSNYF